jgi:DamX protein
MPATQAKNTRRQQQFHDYLAFYQFERDPFYDAGSIGLFYSGAERKKTVDDLLHFSRYGSAPLLLTGGLGAGKSAVLLEFARNVEPDVSVAIIAAQLMLSYNQILSDILAQLRVTNIPSDTDYFSVLTQWVVSEKQRERQVVIGFDDAHNLSAEFIAPFVELHLQYPETLKIVFAGESETAELLQAEFDAHDLLLNSIELPALSTEQIAEYVQYRLASVGYTGEFPLSEMQIKAVSLRSRGSLQYLNDQIREMLMAAVDGSVRSQKKFPVFHTIAALLLVLLVLWLWQRGEPTTTLAIDQPISLENIDPVTGNIVEPVAREQAKLDAAEQQSTVNSSEKAEPAASERVTSSLAELPASVVIGAAADQQAVESATQPSIDKDVAQNIAVDEKARSEVPSTSETAELLPEKQVAAPDPVHQRLLGWPQLGYALQIFGTHNPQRARSLVEKYVGSVELIFYETRHNGKPWFVVVSGPYSGREGAQAAVETLPESLQRLRPWPRNIASIKSDIKRYAAIAQGSARQQSANPSNN